MATTRQKEAARQNLKKARAVQKGSAKPTASSSRSSGMSTADKNDLPDKDFAFPKERKEPLTDAKHVRNAVARFDQVEAVTDAERDSAWKRILRAAKRYDVDVEASSWRDLATGGKDRKS